MSSSFLYILLEKKNAHYEILVIKKVFTKLESFMSHIKESTYSYTIF